VTTALPAPAAPRLSQADVEALQNAVLALESTSFAARLASLAGRQVGFAGRAVSPRLQEVASAAASRALTAALQVAVSSLEGRPLDGDGVIKHRRLAMVSGAIGGAIGLASLPLELPISTTIMLRSIADIARSEGEDLREPEASIACLQVFALGGHGQEGNILEGGYLALRGLFAKTVSDAARFVGARGAVAESSPVLVRLISQIASRFGVVVSQKTAAQAVPLLGAISGAAVNLAFTEHFQSLAKGHFTVRRLERSYGPFIVHEEYSRIAREAGLWGEREAFV
jgi:hypothetical protein